MAGTATMRIQLPGHAAAPLAAVAEAAQRRAKGGTPPAPALKRAAGCGGTAGQASQRAAQSSPAAPAVLPPSARIC